MVSKQQSLRGKNILITGIHGFIGSHLARALQKHGATVYGIAKKGEDSLTVVGDVLDFSFVEQVIQQKKIHICFHLAAESLVEEGQKDPYKTFKTNIVGTLNILEVARKYTLEKIIIASTTHVYGKNKLPYYEGYTPRPTRPYETSKACIDLIAQSYADTYALPVLIPRFVNIYGPGDLNFSRLIPRVMKGIFVEKAVSLWGGSVMRDYLYIDDAIRAYIALINVSLMKVGKNRIFNFGGGNVMSVSELMQKILAIADTNVTIKKTKDERTAEIQSQYVSWNKARKILKWKPDFSFDEGLRKTMEWYRDHLTK